MEYPADVAFRLRRISGSSDVWVGELSVSYDGGPWMLGVGIHEFRGDRIARERIYVTEPWEAPEWRTPWRAATDAGEPARRSAACCDSAILGT